MLPRRSKIKSWLKFVALHLKLNGVEMLENCIIVKPCQPRFMIVNWNHRVEDKLLYHGVRLFVQVVSSSRAAVRMADICLTEMLGVQFYCYGSTKLPAATVRFC